MPSPEVVPKAEDPAPTAPSATTADPASSTPLGKWPWVASAILAGVAVLIFVATLYAGWTFITSSDETREDEDWEQILGLIGRVDTLVTLILGAVLGVGVGAAKQSGDTKAAAAAADANAAEAQRQNEVAKKNQEIASKNKEVAAVHRQDLESALAFVARVDADAERRRQDSSGFADESVVHLFRTQQGGAVRPAEALAPLDPALGRLGEEARQILHTMRAKYGD